MAARGEEPMAVDTHPVAEVAQVRVARRSARHDLRAVKIVLHRELLRFLYDRTRMISQLVQPVLWLLIMGTGLSTLVASGGGVNLKTFIFPGVIAMSVMFTAMFSAASIVWDREFGFLREMLVAPVGRGAIVVGKVLGGAIVATFQGIVTEEDLASLIEYIKSMQPPARQVASAEAK